MRADFKWFIVRGGRFRALEYHYSGYCGHTNIHMYTYMRILLYSSNDTYEGNHKLCTGTDNEIDKEEKERLFVLRPSNN